MTDFIHIEPDHEHRPAFAAWGLSQTPALQTASATGWDVPVDLYPSIPYKLLDGAYVDGFPFNVTQAQPVAADVPVVERPKPVRKRAAKKAATKRTTLAPAGPSGSPAAEDTAATVTEVADQGSGDSSGE